jgi:hypothetical protein
MKMASVSELMDTPISFTKTRCRAHNLGFNNWVAAKKPFLNDRHKANCLQFAKAHEHWTTNDWRLVLWTDESSFEIRKSSTQVQVWQKSTEKYQEKNLAPTFKSGQTSTMAWGSFFGNTKGPIMIFPPGQRKVSDFINNIYKPALIPFVDQVDPNRQLTIKEDNTPVHTASASRDFLKRNNVSKWIGPQNLRTLTQSKMCGLFSSATFKTSTSPKACPRCNKPSNRPGKTSQHQF